MSKIYDLVTAKELGIYYKALSEKRVAPIGEAIFPRKKQLGLDLKWIKGSGGLPVVLKSSAFDTKADLRDRLGFATVQTEMPFFKEGMLVKEQDRQELNKVIASGKREYINLILGNIFDDKLNLVAGAEAQEERMRMQLLATGTISGASGGVAYDYDYNFNPENKETLLTTAKWSDVENSNPVEDIQRWKERIIDTTGVEPTKAICTRKTYNYLMRNKAIRLDMNPIGGHNVIMTDSLLQEYLSSKLNLTIVVNNQKYSEEGQVKGYFPDDVFTLIPDHALGNTYFGTTPEESDLLGSEVANVGIVNTGMAITTTPETDPVSVFTKVSMITLPSFEKIDQVFIATVA